MAKATDYLENQLVDHIFRTTSFTKPTQLKIALYTVTPTDSTVGTEVSASGYAQVSLNPLDTNWVGTHGTTSGNSSGTTGLTDNAVEILFGAPTANWGTIVAFAILDQSANMLMYGDVTPNKTVNNGDPAPKFTVGSLDITIA